MQAIIQALNSIAVALTNPFSIFVKTASPGVSAGGNLYYWQIGPVKFIAGRTNALTAAGAAPANSSYTVTLPANFLTTVIASVCSLDANSFVNSQYIAASMGSTPATATIEITSWAGSNGNSPVSWLIVGL